jgi:hypothetical protein
MLLLESSQSCCCKGWKQQRLPAQLPGTATAAFAAWMLFVLLLLFVHHVGSPVVVRL